MRGKSFLSFLAVASCVVAIFVLRAPDTAYAYAIGSTTGTSTGFNTTYDFNGSFQNLILPFKSFFNSLQLNTSTTINIHPTSVVMPPINITPVAQNIFSQLDNWFYGLTHIQLSGLFTGIYNGILWILGILNGIVNWIWGFIR